MSERSFNFQLSASSRALSASGFQVRMHWWRWMGWSFQLSGEGASMDMDEASPCMASSTQHNFDAVASRTTAQRKSTVLPIEVNVAYPGRSTSFTREVVRYQYYHGKARQCCTATWSCAFTSQTAVLNSAGRVAVKYARLKKVYNSGLTELRSL